ncbi:MAG: hypothetical protein AAFR20_02155 [Pseudomonadota bacterium]
MQDAMGVRDAPLAVWSVRAGGRVVAEIAAVLPWAGATVGAASEVAASEADWLTPVAARVVAASAGAADLPDRVALCAGVFARADRAKVGPAKADRSAADGHRDDHRAAACDHHHIGAGRVSGDHFWGDHVLDDHDSAAVSGSHHSAGHTVHRGDTVGPDNSRARHSENAIRESGHSARQNRGRDTTRRNCQTRD